MSNNVPRVWFNRFAIAAVAINCWTTPVLQYIFKKNPRLELLLCRLFDVISDAISSVGVTIILAAQYLPDYSTSTTNFDIRKCWSNSLWYSYMLTEFRQLFVRSWFDFFIRMLFALTILLCMDDVKMLASASENRNVHHEAGSHRAQFWNKRVERCFHVLMVTWGCIIICLHIEASFEKNMAECLVLLHPWMTAKPACSYMEINCMKQSPPILDLAAELDAVWSPIEANMLTVLEIISCSDLHFPHSFQSFVGLNVFYLMGSNVNEWEQDTALTQTHHPNMHQLALIFNNLSTYCNGSVLPPGLTNPDFPTHLLYIFIAVCNLIDLPDNLDTIWPREGINLLLIGNAFTIVPDVVLRMDISRLNLDLNLIKEIPAELFELKSLRWLDVLGNPISSFPMAVKPSSSLSIFNFALTNVSWLPDWMTSTEFLNQVSMLGSETPLCSDSSTAVRSRFNCQDPPILILDQIKDKRK